MPIILASGSPRRRELLHLITDDFTVKVSGADETADENMSPEQLVLHLSEIKGAQAAGLFPDSTVISADSVVAVDNKILGKPQTEAQAFEMLSLLSGKTHEVYTGVCIRKNGKAAHFAEKTEVTFYPLSKEEIREYIKTGEPFDKAGGYGIQGKGALFVKSIAGDYYNVMGLPVARLARALRELE